MMVAMLYLTAAVVVVILILPAMPARWSDAFKCHAASCLTAYFGVISHLPPLSENLLPSPVYSSLLAGLGLN